MFNNVDYQKPFQYYFYYIYKPEEMFVFMFANLRNYLLVGFGKNYFYSNSNVIGY